MRDFVDKTETSNGTPLNRDTLMALQGFDTLTTVFHDDGSITQSNLNGDYIVTRFNDDGTITDTFVGSSGKQITKTTYVYQGVIEEVIS